METNVTYLKNHRYNNKSESHLLGLYKKKKWNIGELNLSRVIYPPDTMMKAHYDDCYHISIVISGNVRESCSSFTEEASSFSVVTKPPDAKHSNQFGPQKTLIYSVEIPETQLNTPGRPSSNLLQWRWLHTRGSFIEVTGLLEAVRTCNRKYSETIDLVNERLEILLDRIADLPFLPSNDPPFWLQCVKNKLHDTYKQSIPVSTLAKEAKVHPTHLTRWFNKFYGCPVTTYRNCLRVKATADALASEDTPLAQIALEGGFYDQSHFTHVFRKQTGKTPANFRQVSSNL